MRCTRSSERAQTPLGVFSDEVIISCFYFPFSTQLPSVPVPFRISIHVTLWKCLQAASIICFWHHDSLRSARWPNPGQWKWNLLGSHVSDVPFLPLDLQIKSTEGLGFLKPSASPVCKQTEAQSGRHSQGVNVTGLILSLELSNLVMSKVSPTSRIFCSSEPIHFPFT